MALPPLNRPGRTAHGKCQKDSPITPDEIDGRYRICIFEFSEHAAGHADLISLKALACAQMTSIL